MKKLVNKIVTVLIMTILTCLSEIKGQESMIGSGKILSPRTERRLSVVPTVSVQT